MSGESAAIAALTWENELSEAARCVNTERPLTHSLDLGEEGLAMKATRLCSLPDCQARYFSLGYCRPHYRRLKVYGDPTYALPVLSVPERFWSRVDKTEDCWIWTAGATKQGYGGFHPEAGLMVLAHRWAYEALVGPIPDGLVIDHLCRTRRCVNPLHLEPVTNIENLRRGAGYALQNGMRETCVKGHPATAENRYVSRSGKTSCRECRREYDRQPHRLSTLRRKDKES